jgi:predicted SnoaL-like aldol condensation-catalyzing enzyme
MKTAAISAGILALSSYTLPAMADFPAPKGTKPAVLPMTAHERANVDFVETWWLRVIEAGHLEFVPQYQAESYIQHNPNISTGRQGFLAAFSKDNTPVNPIPSHLTSSIPLAGARGDFVWIMREIVAKVPGDPARSLYRNGFDLLRLEHGQIQEHWDVAHKSPGTGTVQFGQSPKPPGQFPTGRPDEREIAARKVAVRAATQVYLKHDASLMAALFAPDYAEHDPNLLDRQTFASQLANTGPANALASINPTIAIVNGDYVLMMWQAASPDPDEPSKTYPWYYFQLIRVYNGKVAEHWDSERPR